MPGWPRRRRPSAPLAAERDTARAERDQALADLAACQASHPAAARTSFEACPPQSARPADVVAKWGPGAGVRAFGGDIAGTWRRPEVAGVCHVSAKPPIDVPLDEAAVVAWVAELLPGDMVEVWHELDVKAHKATLPTVGTDVPVLTIPVAAGVTTALAFGAIGKRLSAGIGIAVTANGAATDTTAVGAGAQISATFF